MRKVEKTNSLYGHYVPSLRHRHTPHVHYGDLCRVAKSLATALDGLHGRGYVVGDINESNAYISDAEQVTLIDSDSFQVTDFQTTPPTIHRCLVGKPEYTPPELQGKSFAETDRNVNHDRFALAVAIYQLLMEGTHPFRGRYTGTGERPQVEACISRGYFLHSRRTNIKVPLEPVPTAVPWESLPSSLRDLFHRCFDEGHLDPQRRPAPREWADVLQKAIDPLETCSVNPNHRCFRERTRGRVNRTCTWCDRKARTGIESFPSVTRPRPSGIALTRPRPISAPPQGRGPSSLRPVTHRGRRSSREPPDRRGRRKGVIGKVVGTVAAGAIGGGIL